MMNEGHPEYGCFISKDKTMTNFDYDHHVLNVTDPHQQCKRAHLIYVFFSQVSSFPMVRLRNQHERPVCVW
ncbi:hypothetical protein EV421DRAFT_1779810 [Armillaria borealis]|uniref:Uncharacterized protein n=1 Tax=Armillaria borealis TaxID=47425 RepID=A0AA39MX48_9AGAR|nr:hypothetical protein EV421DRAFT_1779810 [Armillaria borealis]